MSTYRVMCREQLLVNYDPRENFDVRNEDDAARLEHAIIAYQVGDSLCNAAYAYLLDRNTLRYYLKKRCLLRSQVEIIGEHREHEPNYDF